MSTRTTEQTIHNDVIGAYLINPEASGGLGWTKGNANQVIANGLIRPESLYRFLRAGNSANEKAWESIKRKAGDEKKAEAEALSAVQDAIDQSDTIVQLFRDGVDILGIHFDLWNAPEGRGTLQSQSEDFGKNEFITVAQLSVNGGVSVPETFANARARGKDQKADGAKETAKRVPDQAFFVNGLLYSFLEVKARQTNQSASKEGRMKLAGDFRSFAFGALQRVRHEFELSEGRAWPGFSAGRTNLAPTWQKRVMTLLGAYAKTPWMAVMDMNDIWLAPEPLEWLALCDASLGNMLSGGPGTSMQDHPNSDMDKNLNTKMSASFSRMPDISGAAHAWDHVKAHLSSLLSFKGVARDIALWHHLVLNKNKKDIVGKSLFRPRAPQRVAIDQALSFVETFYQNEQDPQWAENDLRAKLALSLPALSQEQANQVILDRLKYRNGQDAYSVLIQGAAGLGKTHIAVCLALSLYNMLAPRAKGASKNVPSEVLFDRIVVLTDRVELRQNIADEAHRSGSSRGQVLEVDDQETLVAALTGGALPRGRSGSILVVNMQKFPSLAANIKDGSIQVKHSVGRTAFIIDEIHRSQSGELNEAATQSFVTNLSHFSAGGNGTRKNLVIGLTATPTDPILARFGQWRPGVSAADQTRWIPHFSYAMNQAVADGYVLDPLKGLVKLGVSLQILTTETLEEAGDAKTAHIPSDVLYEDDTRQKIVAERFAEIFVGTTMLAMPHSRQAASTGRGKAMITVPTVRAAITMVEHVRTALRNLAKNSKGKPWEAYADTVKNVADERVFVLYSKPSTGQGKDLDACGRYNTQLGTSPYPTEKQIIDGFRCKSAGQNTKAKNSIIVVVDKLLTGFDESTLHTLLIARSMQGVALFQGMCRVNRVADGKTGCLVVDASHGDQVSNEAHRVFSRFGNLSTSDLNGLDLLERLKERRKRLLAWVGLKEAWLGKKVLTAQERTEDRNAWAGRVGRDAEKATELRRMIGGYLADQKLAKNLMRVDKDDLRTDWLDFLREIHNLMRLEGGGEGDAASILFEVHDIGLDDIVIAEAAEAKYKEKLGDSVESIVDDMPSENDNEGTLLDQIDRVREIEETRAMRTASVRQFLDELFLRIDACSQKENNDEFRRSLSDPHNAIPHDEALKKFTRLFDIATGDRAWIGKNDTDKRRYRELARGRLEILLGDYRMR